MASSNMTALLAMLAMVGWQNRDKLGELLGAVTGQRPTGPSTGANPGVGAPGSGAGGLGGLLGGLLGGGGTQGLSGGLGSIVAGLGALTDGAAELVNGGTVKQTVITMTEGNVFVMSISDGSLLGVYASPDCDPGMVGYQMARFVGRAGHSGQWPVASGQWVFGLATGH